MRFQLTNGGPGTVNVYAWPKGRRRFVASLTRRAPNLDGTGAGWEAPDRLGHIRYFKALRPAVRLALSGPREEARNAARHAADKAAGQRARAAIAAGAPTWNDPAATLPSRGYLANPPTMAGAVVLVIKGEEGFFRVIDLEAPEAAQVRADYLNTRDYGRPLRPEEAAAMLAGSMFGWTVPAADPDNYEPGTDRWKRARAAEMPPALAEATMERDE